MREGVFAVVAGRTADSSAAPVERHLLWHRAKKCPSKLYHQDFLKLGEPFFYKLMFKNVYIIIKASDSNT